ncbi:hypothetical protein [Kitasatospora azatica]|uniref:hypothetical protein n=1 Tax=Kitasatospora azatica TaxID=58347 RepID=UPI000559E358|nr:hypothetical protein [Kitasatospora azatica]
MLVKKLAVTAAVAGALLTAGLATATSASAINYDCSSGTVCLYYNSSSHGYGAVFQQYVDIANYSSPYNFTFSAGNNGSAGAGVSVKNNAAAVDSWYSGNFVVYYNSNYSCSFACQTIPSMATVDLSATMKNNNASGAFR